MRIGICILQSGGSGVQNWVLKTGRQRRWNGIQKEPTNNGKSEESRAAAKRNLVGIDEDGNVDLRITNKLRREQPG